MATWQKAKPLKGGGRRAKEEMYTVVKPHMQTKNIVYNMNRELVRTTDVSSS